MAKQVDITYGNALFELAVETNQIDVIYEEVEQIINIITDNDDLIEILTNPQLSKEEKVNIIETVFKSKVCDEITGFMVMMVKKDHSRDLIKAFKAFCKFVKNHKNIGDATVTSAVSLSDQQKQTINQKLIDTTKYSSLDITFNVDKTILGGLVIRIEDRVVDSSIKNRIDTLSKTLLMA